MKIVAMSFEEKIKNIPPEYKHEVEEFVDKVLQRTQRKTGPISQSWAGGAKDLKNKYNSVELQHKISDWIIEKYVSR